MKKSRKLISDYDVCKAYQERKPFDKEWAYEILAKRFDVPEIVAYRACERAEKRGYLDYGTSLRSGWLTDKGKELLTNKNL